MTDTSLFVLFVGFLLRVTGSSCPVTLSPPRVVVKYGDPVSINCTAHTQHRGMGWEAPVGGTGRKTGVSHVTWSMSNLTNPSMESECFINPVSAEQCSKHAVIVLYTTPQRVYISSNSSDGTMVEGEDYYLTCEVHDAAPVDYLSVKWYKNNTHFLTERLNSSITKLPNASKYNFTPTRENLTVDFRCEAHMDLRPEGPYINVSSQIFKTNVQFGPEMNCSIVEINEGDTLDSSCPVLGNPNPQVKWLRNGQQINSSVPLRREDSGSYNVEAEGLTIIQKDVEVRVKYGPELSCAESYTVLEHTTVNLPCTFGGYPQPKVTLYKDEDEVVRNLEDIRRNDAGQYTLVASTETHSVNQTFEIIVLYPPSQIFELEDSDFTVGASVSLKCSAYGNPRPQYYWTYYNSTNVSEENDDGVSRLVIHNATAYNIGNYTCLASNEHGAVSKTARLTVEGVQQECPLHITPDRMLLEYGERQRATCQALFTSTNVDEIYWEDYRGAYNSLEWVADFHHWDPRPVCKARFKGIGECEKKLNFTLYKKPDNVSISIEAADSTLKEGDSVTLICEITSVAPAQSVSVRWYQGNESFTPPNEVHVICDKCNISETGMIVNMWFSTNITANRTHNGAEFLCEAALNLTGEPLIFLPMSRTLNITVHYPPTINTTKLSSMVPVISGYAEDLVCEADGNPPPNITWISNSEKSSQPPKGVLSVTEAGTYKCHATNTQGSDYREVTVILKVDYLPLLAGFVAVTVVGISIMFVFIYSIYYKNTKMRRYSLKNPKLSGHNGNVAHNGYELPLPMTKLS